MARLNVQLILDYMKRENLSRQKFCEKSGIEYNKFCLFLNGKIRYFADMLEEVCEFTGISADELLRLENELDD